MLQTIFGDAANWELADLAIAVGISLGAAIAIFRLSQTETDDEAVWNSPGEDEDGNDHDADP